MSDQITTIFVLTGALEGKTIILGSQKFSFVDGRMEVTLSQEDTEKISQFLRRNWQAVPENKVTAPTKASVAPKANETEAKKAKSKE